jgi:hypothetical protein
VSFGLCQRAFHFGFERALGRDRLDLGCDGSVELGKGAARRRGGRDLKKPARFA